ncbi:hypothetical protein J7426_19830 [Tropicibacter sp. R16_0]|nr:hypothetical protein [Tropicibacter sp. R16_0]MBO9452532.1 hypothetical protein [Tropicibacter sp. R16_0]
MARPYPAYCPCHVTTLWGESRAIARPRDGDATELQATLSLPNPSAL